MRRAAIVAAGALVVGSLVAPAPGAAQQEGRTYQPPVAAPVADPFRPPPEPWMAGNRGIEYRTVPGTAVRAIGPGVVTFAGMVVGERDVTVSHPDGLRSSYVDLAVLEVAVGDRVAGGQVVGRSTDRLHLGVRRGRAYLDPASLWGTPVGGGRVVLVPLDDPGGAGGGGGDRPAVGPVPGAGLPPALDATDLVGPALALAVAARVAAA